jgi:hypothetical protein
MFTQLASQHPKFIDFSDLGEKAQMVVQGFETMTNAICDETLKKNLRKTHSLARYLTPNEEI